MHYAPTSAGNPLVSRGSSGCGARNLVFHHFDGFVEMLETTEELSKAAVEKPDAPFAGAPRRIDSSKFQAQRACLLYSYRAIALI
jgi:hypothetical protein